jgi:hypothetical protein
MHAQIEAQERNEEFVDCCKGILHTQSRVSHSQFVVIAPEKTKVMEIAKANKYQQVICRQGQH